MHLTRLTLYGFKSFGERTTIEFPPGVTAIIGPNGSGKSNVIEALRWASGGGRASEFRAGEKTDLIFHGASGKRGLSYAEVELELDDDGRTITIQRSLYRDGSGKLKLNGKAARFIDIDARLSGSGLGKGSPAIIGQGEVGQVLMATPERLLEQVAEAVGVARLANHRAQTEARLASANEHLVRLNDIVEELRAQAELLSEEATQAQRYEALMQRRVALRYTLSQQRIDGLTADIAGLRQEATALAAALDSDRAQLAEVQRRWQQARQQVEALELAYRQALAAAEAKRGDLRVAEARLNALERRRQDLAEQRARTAQELEALVNLSEPPAPESDLAALEQAQQQAQAAYAETQQALAALERQVTEVQRELERRRRTQQAYEQAQAGYQSRKEQLEQQLAELKQRDEALRDEVADIPTLEQQLAERQALLAAARDEYEALRDKLQAASNALAHRRAEHETLSRSARRAREAFEARRGYAQGPKHALTSGIRGVLGSVADLIRVPERYRQAVASSLGRRSEYVVVDSAETGQAVLEHVKRAGGWVTVLPLELLDGRPGELPASLAGEPGVIGLLSELIDYEARFTPVIAQLLGSTALVDSLDTAVRLARKLRSRPRLVTLAGDILEGYGAMSGGQVRGGLGVIGLAAELEEAEQAVARAARELADSQAALAALQETAQQRKAALQQLNAECDQLAAKVSELTQQQRVRASLRGELKRQMAQLAAALAGLQPPQAPEPAALAEQEDTYQRLSGQLKGLRQQLEAAGEARQKAQQTLVLEQARWQQHARELARYHSDLARRQALQERQRALEAELAAIDAELQSARAHREAASAQLPDLSDQETALSEAQQAARALEAELSALSSAQAKRAEALESLHVTLARREAALELAQQEHSQLPTGSLLELSNRAAREQLSAVEAELEALGPINHRAALDLKQLQERLGELEGQLAEARAAAEALSGALAKLDREITERLDRAVSALRSAFRHYVEQLFGQGATADILTEREGGRPKGLQIALQPPGKQTTALNLLSVGERTMGAMAFLFSLMRSSEQQGLSIAILDEVDAPLDEANIRRFCRFVKRLADSGTQFILVTHQKATFDIADALWGVTADRGVSRVFSIRKGAEAPHALG